MDMKFENVEIPFRNFGNRQVLTDWQIIRDPWIKDFIDAFPMCFEYEPWLGVWFYCPDGNAGMLTR